MIIIDRPIITEKSIATAANGVYTFAVNDQATKLQVAQAVEKVYGVKVAKVRVLTVTGKEVRRRTGLGKENDWKKAMVTLEKGQTIKDFEFEAAEAGHDHDHDHKHDHKDEKKK